MIFLVFMGFIVGANAYVFIRLWQIIPNLYLKLGILTVGILAIGSLVLSMAAREVLPVPLMSFLYKFGTSYFFIFIYILIFILLADLAKLIHLLPAHFMRNNWTIFICLTSAIVLIFSYGYFRYLHKDRVELNLSLVPENATQNKLKIVAISDLHLGFNIKNPEFEKWVTLINRENPDIVFIAGDAIDNSLVPVEKYHTDSVLKKIKAKYGVFAISGNHEYISGIDRSRQFLEKSNICFLTDSAALIDNLFYVVGRDDASNKNRKSIAQLVEDIDFTKPVILLDHQPYHLEEAVVNGIDLQISGHTHDGQIFPISLITKTMYEKSHGYLKKGDTHFYISSGIGIWGGKFRIGTKSEYTIINLSF
jgi:predicted MPP superfamily phosphohydrolase